MTVWWKALTPLGGVAAIAAAAALVALVLGGLGFRWDPLDLDRRRLVMLYLSRSDSSARSVTISSLRPDHPSRNWRLLPR